MLQGCNSMCAGYLFQPDKQYDVTYDTGDKAIQCGRHVDIFKFWLMWKAKVGCPYVVWYFLLTCYELFLFFTNNLRFCTQGTIGFEQHIDRCLEISEHLYNKIKNREGYQMVFEGQVC